MPAAASGKADASDDASSPHNSAGFPVPECREQRMLRSLVRVSPEKTRRSFISQHFEGTMGKAALPHALGMKVIGFSHQGPVPTAASETPRPIQEQMADLVQLRHQIGRRVCQFDKYAAAAGQPPQFCRVWTSIFTEDIAEPLEAMRAVT